MTDLVLSSGFLAFAAHCGFLRAVEERGLAVDGVCGTSSGALVGALWAAGLPAEEVLARVTRRAPLWSARPTLAPWRGLFGLSAVVADLRKILPATFEELPRPFAVGVATPGGAGHALLSSGPLPEAVAASCAVPRLFVPVTVEGRPWIDGAIADRTGLSAWRQRRRAPMWLHLIDRSAGQDRTLDLGPDVTLVRSPRSRARLWNLGDRQAEYTGALERTRAALVAVTATATG